MKIGMVTIAYNQPDGLKSLFNTAALSKEKVEFFLFLHSEDVNTERACKDLAGSYTVHYFPHKTNRGISKSWNDGILLAMENDCDVVITCNDDIWFEDEDIDKIASAALEHRDRFAIVAAGFNHFHSKRVCDHGFSCFALNPIAIREVGMFDENLFPAYLEDCDYSYRASALAGLSHYIVSDTNVHHLGSETIFTSSLLRMQNHLTHTLNFEYYKRKWGGINGHETLTCPFNDAKFNHFIDPDSRHDPYPGYGRTDHNIVKV